MSHHKQPERRTFLQDRFDILLKRQKSGQASFNELTELDEIVNADPVLREKIIRENLLMEDEGDFNEQSNNLEKKENLSAQKVQHRSILKRIQSFLSRIFTSFIYAVKYKILSAPYAKQAVFI
ncbi:MAG: hypothetical protein JWQ63_2037 [Mucilaginibacter sp.]|jgi:hypothetical protein|nr:hypothetical protein [Mucilaginibacter sp.]